MVYIEACGSAKTINGSNAQHAKVIKACTRKALNSVRQSYRDAVKNNAMYIMSFGTYTTKRSSTVKDVHKKCKDGITSKTVTYDLTPKMRG